MAKAKGNAIALTSAEQDWQTEDDLRTLQRAKEVEADPKRLRKAQRLAKTRLMEMAAIASDTDDKD